MGKSVINIKPTVHRRLKVYCVKLGKPLGEWAEEILLEAIKSKTVKDA